MFNTCESKVSGTIGTIPIDKTFKRPQSRKTNLFMPSEPQAVRCDPAHVHGPWSPWSPWSPMESMESIV